MSSVYMANNLFKQVKKPLIKRQFTYLPALLENINQSLMPWEEINTILWEARLNYPRIRLHKDGNTIPEDAYIRIKTLRRGSLCPRIQEDMLYKHLRDGATLVIDGVEELYPPLNEFIYDIERAFQAKAQVNCYMSWGDTRGFSTHWDDHDVLIIQIHGRKNWFIFGDTRKDPMYRDLHIHQEPPTIPIWNKVIEAGDVLFIPRGCWHHAIALNEPSLHLTVGFSSRTAMNFIEWLQEPACNLPICRQEIPRWDKPEVLKSYNEQLRQALKELIDGLSVEDYLKDYDAKSEKRTIFSLPWAVTHDVLPTGDFSLKINAPYLADIQDDTEKNTFQFIACGKCYNFSLSCKPIFDVLMDWEWHFFSKLIKNLKGGLQEVDVRNFVKELVLCGLLSIRGVK